MMFDTLGLTAEDVAQYQLITIYWNFLPDAIAWEQWRYGIKSVFFMITGIVHDSQRWSMEVGNGEELLTDGQTVN